MIFPGSSCIIAFALLLAPWEFGSLMATIGEVRGWNTRRTFWISSMLYGLLMIGAYVARWIAGDVLQNYYVDFVLGVLAIAFAVVGIVFSPLMNLVVTWRYPDVFKKSTSSFATPGSNAQLTSAKEPLPQKQQLATDAPAVIHGARSGHRFVSYRRSDSADIAGRIYDRLIGKFGKDPVFKDVDSIPLGLDFKEYLDQKVGECDVLLAIIGDGWLNASDATGKNDWKTRMIL